MVCGGDRGSCPRRPQRSRDRLVAAPPLPIIASTLTHAHSRAGRGHWHRWRELNLPWVVFIDDRPTPILYICIGQNESRCVGQTAGSREVSTYESMKIVGVGSIGMHVAGGAAARQRAVHLEQSLQRERVCGSGAAACVAQTTSPASRAVQSGPAPSSASARGRAIDSGRGCSAGRSQGVKRLTAW